MKDIIHHLLMNQVFEQVMLTVAGAVLQEWIGRWLFKRQPRDTENDCICAEEEVAEADDSSPVMEEQDCV